MTVEELITYGKKFISKTQTEMLLGIVLNVNALELLLMLDKVIDEDKVKEFKEKINLVYNKKPIQYVIGNVNFYGNIFKVNESVLIPRFETEELVENTLNLINNYFNNYEKINILDLGTGTGCIGLTIKSKLKDKVNVTLLDISEQALEVAKENAKNLNLDVEFILSDMFNNVKDKYDIIISNPPYIRLDEEIEDLVKENEPHLALYAGIDGLDCYKKIREQFLNYVNDKYLICFEIGDLQKEEVTNLFKDLDNVSITCKKDLQGRDRMLFIEHNLKEII